MKLEIEELFNDLVDNGIAVEVFHGEIDYIVDSFFEYYKSKNIVDDFVVTMKDHFRDIYNDALDYDMPVTLDFILCQLSIYELCESRVEVDPRDTKKIIKKIRKELGGV